MSESIPVVFQILEIVSVLLGHCTYPIRVHLTETCKFLRDIIWSMTNVAAINTKLSVLRVPVVATNLSGISSLTVAECRVTANWITPIGRRAYNLFEFSNLHCLTLERVDLGPDWTLYLHHIRQLTLSTKSDTSAVTKLTNLQSLTIFHYDRIGADMAGTQLTSLKVDCDRCTFVCPLTLKALSLTAHLQQFLLQLSPIDQLRRIVLESYF